jgi:hypothetical protein
MIDLSKIILRADLLRAMRVLLAWISAEGARLNAPEVVINCRESNRIVGALLLRETM